MSSGNDADGSGRRFPIEDELAFHRKAVRAEAKADMGPEYIQRERFVKRFGSGARLVDRAAASGEDTRPWDGRTDLRPDGDLSP